MTATLAEIPGQHLKGVFAKVSVRSRGELVTKLFADHCRLALHAPDGNVYLDL